MDRRRCQELLVVDRIRPLTPAKKSGLSCLQHAGHGYWWAFALHCTALATTPRRRGPLRESAEAAAFGVFGRAGTSTGGHNVAMVQESVHVSTSIERPAGEVYVYITEPANLSLWAAGLASSPVHQVDGAWVADSPLGRVVVAFVAPNDLGVADHDVTLPSGETVTNPLRVLENGEGCDVVFSVRRQPEMSDADFAADVDAVTRDLAALRSILET
jgi:hypothetical protein